MKLKKKVIPLFMLLAITVLGVMYSPDQKAFAAETAAKICAVSYTDESILVFNNSNTKIYYATESDASKGTWDVINVVGTEPITVIDISWLSPNKENILVVKGDNDPTQERVIINKRPQKLEVSINYSQMNDPTLTDATVIGSLLNIMATEGTGLYPITFYDLQWKKGEDGHWMSTDTLTKGLLKSYLIKGTYIYFRIAPVDDVVSATKDLSKSAYLYAYTKPKFGDDTFGAITFGTDYPDGTKGNRPSNEVKLKITKQASLPVTGIDGGDFALQIKYGKEYRVTINGGTPTAWTQVTDKSVKSLPLKVMVNNLYDGLTDATAFPMLLIEIRDYATSKAAASKIVETHLKAQRQLSNTIILGPVPPATAIPDPNIYVAYNGSKNITVTIPTASADTPYEYCIVKSGSTFDVAKASWTSITKSAAVKIMSSKAVDFGTLYVRMKEIKYKKATKTSNAIDYELASTYQTFTIKYPAVPVATKTTYTYTKGYPTTIKITVTLNTAGKEPFETSLKYVKLGTKDVAVESTIVTPAIVAGVIDPTNVYTMEIILKSTELETMTNCTGRALSIYYGNNTVDKTSSKLTIKSPTAASSLTATPAQGIGSGTTAVTVANALGSGNSFVYTIGPAAVTGKNKEDTITGLAFTSGADIAITPVDQYLTIYEINTLSQNIVRYKSIKITSAYIKP